MLLTAEQNVNGFSTLIVPSQRSEKPHHLRYGLAITARCRGDTSSNNAETANPKLRGTRHKNFGKKLRTWMESYGALLEFKRLNQHCRVPYRYSLDRPLGRWVSELRTNGREKLSLDQLKLLDKSGFDWESNGERQNRLWQESYQRLIEYKEEHGDCCVPKKYKKDKALGKWVDNQRQHRKQGAVDREEQLDAIGFTWSAKDSPSRANTTRVDRLWNETFDRLLEFREEWGHCLVPKVFDEDPSLGRWVATQRVLFKRGQLLSDRKKRLEEVGFVFEPSNTEQNLNGRHWDLMFQRLVDYAETHGDTDVKHHHEEYGLGRWVGTQRLNKNIMDEERRKQLNAIGFEWGNPRTRHAAWQKRYEELCEYSTVHGTCRVKEKENLRLARWVWQQRHRIKRGKLSEAQIKKLESLGFR